jgi:hypothetical protein
VTVDSPDLLAAKPLLDLAKDHGFSFQRVVPGEDGPLLDRRQTLAWIDEIYLAGFSDACSAIWRRRFSLIMPGGLPVAERITGDVLTVVTDWPT